MAETLGTLDPSLRAGLFRGLLIQRDRLRITGTAGFIEHVRDDDVRRKERPLAVLEHALCHALQPEFEIHPFESLVHDDACMPSDVISGTAP